MALDPLSVLGVASAAVRFVSFTSNLIGKTIFKHGQLEAKARDFERDLITQNLKDLSAQLNQAIDIGNGDGTSEALQIICMQCKDDADKLLSILRQTHGHKKQHSSRTATSRNIANFRQALASSWPGGESEVVLLERRLDRLRQQLILHVLVSLKQRDEALRTQVPRNELDANSNPLVGKQFLDEAFPGAGLNSNTQRKQWEQQLIAEIFQGPSLNGTHCELSKMPLSSDAMCLPVSAFLQNLEFDEIACRHQQIAQAHEETFKWIFESSARQHDSWSNFPAWLEAESGPNIYWITGKAGSGKSTLMKYLYRHERTAHYLHRRRSDQQDLTIVAFFFWAAPNAERSLLNSQEGLLRTLLHQVFKQKPELIQLACPRRWDACKLFGFDSHEWTWEELLNTARSVLANSDGRFFFLIDGLDEFHGDHNELLNFIHLLARDSRIKLCVSSRPWLVFEDSFDQKPSLMLHNLTAKDIKHFAKTKMLESKGFEELNRSKPDIAIGLIDEIARKSSGVFLWVRIVVRALREGFRNGDHESELRKRIDDLPAELENLFKNILESMRAEHKKDASLLFQIVRAARCPIDLLSLSFADSDDPDFAVALQPGIMEHDERLWQCKRMRRRLTSRCLGLLELVDVDVENEAQKSVSLSSSWVGDEFVDQYQSQDTAYINRLSRSRIQYMHRTVKDYVERTEVWEKLVKSTPNFNPHQSLCHAALVQLKIQDPKLLTLANFWAQINEIMHYAALAEHTSRRPMVCTLDELDRVGHRFSKLLDLTSRHGGPEATVRLRGRSVTAHTKEPHWTVSQSETAREYSFLCFAVQYRLYYYVEAKLELDRSLLTQSPISRSLLDCAILEYQFLSDFSEGPPEETARNADLVQLLLANGDDPNRVDYFKSTPWIHVLYRVKKEHTRVEGRKRRGLSAEPDHMDYWMRVVELFIEYGADPWKRIDTETNGALKAHNSARAVVLEKMLKKERRMKSWGQIKRVIAGR